MRMATSNAKTTTRFIPILDDILEETEQYLILNKRAGLAVHGGSGIQAGVIEAIKPATRSTLHRTGPPD